VTTSIPGGLAQYLADRDQQRAEAVAQRLNELSPREQALVREAAVMGYVQGVRAVPGSWQQQIPHDKDIVHTVIDACRAFDDLYPLLAGRPDALARRIVHQHQPVPPAHLAEAVSTLTLMAVGEVEALIRSLVDDELLVEAPDGLREAI
jgi:hypothetical protein